MKQSHMMPAWRPGDPTNYDKGRYSATLASQGTSLLQRALIPAFFWKDRGNLRFFHRFFLSFLDSSGKAHSEATLSRPGEGGLVRKIQDNLDSDSRRNIDEVL
jgi:hypothetical protein